MLAILFYDVVVAIHVMAIVIAFGVTFAYPVLIPYALRNYPRAMPAIHAAQERIARLIITPFATLALITGIYLATDRDYWDEVWVTVPLLILTALLALGGAYFSPRTRRLQALAERDVAASGADNVSFAAEYQSASRQMALVGTLANVLILVAIFFMVVKP